MYIYPKIAPHFAKKGTNITKNGLDKDIDNGFPDYKKVLCEPAFLRFFAFGLDVRSTRPRRVFFLQGQGEVKCKYRQRSGICAGGEEVKLWLAVFVGGRRTHSPCTKHTDAVHTRPSL